MVLWHKTVNVSTDDSEKMQNSYDSLPGGADATIAAMPMTFVALGKLPVRSRSGAAALFAAGTHGITARAIGRVLGLFQLAVGIRRDHRMILLSGPVVGSDG